MLQELKFEFRFPAEKWLKANGFSPTHNEYIWEDATRQAFVGLELGGYTPRVSVRIYPLTSMAA